MVFSRPTIRPSAPPSAALTSTLADHQAEPCTCGARGRHLVSPLAEPDQHAEQTANIGDASGPMIVEVLHQRDQDQVHVGKHVAEDVSGDQLEDQQKDRRTVMRATLTTGWTPRLAPCPARPAQAGP